MISHSFRHVCRIRCSRESCERAHRAPVDRSDVPVDLRKLPLWSSAHGNWTSHVVYAQGNESLILRAACSAPTIYKQWIYLNKEPKPTILDKSVGTHALFLWKLSLFDFPLPPPPYQSWICGLKVHFFEATLTRGEGGRHFAQMWPFRVLKTERLANTCHILRLSQGLLSRIVWRQARRKNGNNSNGIERIATKFGLQSVWNLVHVFDLYLSDFQSFYSYNAGNDVFERGGGH